MKKISKLSYVILIIVIAGLCVAIYSTTSKGVNEKNNKEKIFAEVEYFGGKIETLLNKLNNIDVRNYNISISEISKQQEEQQSKSTSNQGKEEAESDSSTSSSSSSTSNTNSSSEQGANGTAQQTETGKKYEMVRNGVLLDSGKIEWQNIKSEIEILYETTPTLTLDLYQIGISQDDILGFNKDFDKVVDVIKAENKEEALSGLSLIYEYISKFTKNATDDEITKKLTETKSHIYKAYSKLDSKRWDEIKSETKEAVRVYNELLSNSSIEPVKQYGISKGFVMINELQSSADSENETAYLIKYKNFLEEINNI